MGYRAVWCVDFEFRAEGDPPDVHCLAAVELLSGRVVRLWRDELGSRPPFDVGDDVLLVAFYASAEIGCFLSLGWPVPSNVLDLYAEYRNATNGKRVPFGRKLTGALAAYGLAHLYAEEKADLQALARRGGPYSASEREALMDYCLEDARALAALLPRMLPQILERRGRSARVNLFHALLRGRYMAAAARMERIGVPIDVCMLTRLTAHWDAIQARLIDEVDPLYGVYEGGHFKLDKFAAYLDRQRISWPRTETGRLKTDKDTLSDMAKLHPQLNPLHELRTTLGGLRLNGLEVGTDGRNRTLLSAFGAATGRNAPSTARFIFGPARWMRGLIAPPPGLALAYCDWSAQEVAIAAGLSRDPAMMGDYAQDPYLAFAKRIGRVPPDATKKSHAAERDAMKPFVLGVGYGMGPLTMAQQLGKTDDETRRLLQEHHRAYPRFWRWVDAAVDHASLRGFLETRLGWNRAFEGDEFKVPAAMNSPMQGNGAEMMRLASIYATEAGLEVCAPVHDALLVQGPEDRIEEVAAELSRYMRRASADLLDGFEVRTGITYIRPGTRYIDERGEFLWTRITALLDRLEAEESAGSIGLPAHIPSEFPKEGIGREREGIRSENPYPLALSV